MYGGAGNDGVSYFLSNAGVIVSLVANAGLGGEAEGDKLDSIENLHGSNFQDLLVGDYKKNLLEGYYGDDALKGGGGDDTLDGEDGDDTMNGGYGNDTFIVDSAGDDVFEKKDGGNDTVKTTVSYTLAADVWVETLRTTDDKGTDAINLTGNNRPNYLVGNAGANILDGGYHDDTMSGGAGNDIYFISESGDLVLEAVGLGGDTVRSQSSYELYLGAEVEALTTTNNNGTDAINFTGNHHTQVIVGNAGVNLLQGLGGDDQLQGMAGNDTLTGGVGKDKFLFSTALNAATNVDTITDMTAGVDIIRLDDAHFAGIGPVAVLNDDAFHVGAGAADAEDRIIYNSTTGQLFFDSNGNSAGGVTHFANLTKGLTLSNADFYVV